MEGRCAVNLQFSLLTVIGWFSFGRSILPKGELVSQYCSVAVFTCNNHTSATYIFGSSFAALLLYSSVTRLNIARIASSTYQTSNHDISSLRSYVAYEPIALTVWISFASETQDWYLVERTEKSERLLTYNKPLRGFPHPDQTCHKMEKNSNCSFHVTDNHLELRMDPGTRLVPEDTFSNK